MFKLKKIRTRSSNVSDSVIEGTLEELSRTFGIKSFSIEDLIKQINKNALINRNFYRVELVN